MNITPLAHSINEPCKFNSLHLKSITECLLIYCVVKLCCIRNATKVCIGQNKIQVIFSIYNNTAIKFICM